MDSDFPIEIDWDITPEKVQGSRAWLEWRKKGLGASDAPIIMGVSPWKTPLQLYLEKTGQVEPEPAGWAADRGNRLEPIARKAYETLRANDVGPLKFPAQTFESGAYLRASLDGFNKELNRGLEIKCIGKATYEMALNGEIPIYYYWQIQHQLHVTGAELIDYCVYYVAKGDDEATGKVCVITQRPNQGDMTRYLKKAHDFWRCIQTKTPPPLTDADFKVVRQKKLIALLDFYKTLLDDLDRLKKRSDSVKDEITTLVKEVKHPRVRCGDATITLVNKIGAVNYKDVPELNNVNLEKYRKKGSSYYKIAFPVKGKENVKEQSKQ